MTVHMIRIKAEKPDQYTIDQIRTAVHDWVDKHEEVLGAKRVDVTLAAEEPYDPAEEHVRADFRFAQHEEKHQLLDKAESKLQNYVSWYLLGHHWCTHDGTGGECSWDATAEYGAVPAEVSL